MTAYHEAGHALCAALLPSADPVHKVTILPRGMALGVTQQLPEEEKHSYSQEYLEESIIVAMGGRVAEDLVFGQRSTGAANDLQVSTERARQDGHRVRHVATDRAPRLRQLRRRCSSARTSATCGSTPRRPPRSSTTRSTGSCARPRTAAGSCSIANRRALDLIARALLEEETVSGAEVNRLIRVANGTEPDVGRPAPPASHGSPTPVHGHVPGSQNPGCGDRSPAAAPAPQPRRRGPGPQRRPLTGTFPDRHLRRPLTVSRRRRPRSHRAPIPGSRSSATAAHRWVALTGPTNDRRTTPASSAMATMGTASMA